MFHLNQSSRWTVRFLWALIAVTLGACAGAHDASKSISRDAIESGGVAPAEEIRVAEYLSYYEQHFPEPVDATLGLDLRAGNNQIPVEGGEAWLQIGIQARSAREEQLAPLNLALVIDTSGSMGDDEKLGYVKTSLRFFLHSLARNDEVAIISYYDDADVVASSRPVGDGRWIEDIVEGLAPGGSTNLHAGLMAGFREVDARYDVRRNNRVILLTDGIANRGEIDPARIASDARVYNDKGIHLSTIGLGSDIDDALLSELARQGKGAYHFIDSAEEIEKVFQNEVTGLVQKAAGDVSIVIQPAPGVRIEQLTGFEGIPPAGPVEVRLTDMGTGDSQVVMARLVVDRGARGRRRLADVALRYRDAFSDREASLSATALVEAGLAGRYDPLRDVEVLRNATIQRSAEGLKEVDALYQAGRYHDAWSLARRLEEDLRAVDAVAHDEQIARDVDLMQKLQANLAPWAERESYERGSDEETYPRSDWASDRDRRIMPTGPVPQLDIR